ncbi:MAG: PleD family two-component system response regulator, partial [Candidatus Methylomirabilales bacterium]
MAARIIVADDSSTIQKVVELSLAREDVELIQALSGEEAMRKAQDGKPDLMLIDHSMPDRSGSELCGELRKNAQLKDIPIILMAGGKQPFDEAAARRVGANGVVTKPFDSGTLIGKVKQMLTGAPAPPVPEAAPAPAPQEDMVSVEQSPVAVEPLAPSSEEMEPPLSQDLMEEMMAQQPLPTDPSFDLTEPAAAPQAESVPTYDLPSTDVETPSLEKAMEEAAKATPTA